MSLAALAQSQSNAADSTGGRLVTADGRTLPLKAAALTADAKGGVIRVTLEQTFQNPYAEPLKVTYKLPLPADGAVSGFAFRIGDKRVVGEVDTKKQARQRFEDAILDGRTAAILDQERSSLFTQEVGNVPPHTEVVCEVTIDQKLVWLADGAWEWRFPTVVAPRYLGEAGRVVDAAKISVDVADQALPVKLSLGLSIRDRLPEGVRPESPSHTVHTARGLQRHDVTFGDERGVELDRDVVVRWKVAQLTVGASLDVARPKSGGVSDASYGLMTLVPPTAEARMAPVPRDLIVLLDTSGSMSGTPLDQARRIVSAMVDSLGEQDQLELIEFSWAPRRWKSGPVPASPKMRREALSWLARLQANGGTEMKAGILEALAPLRDDAQRQVVLVTDGLIGSEHEVIEAISKRLPKGSRVHVVGVGSGVNRSLTMPAARCGRGVELVIGLGEDPEVATKRLLARTTAPLVTEVQISGSAFELSAPVRVPDLYGGAPALVSLKLSPRGGEVIVRGHTAQGEYMERLSVPAMECGEGAAAVTTLFARELVEDLELNLATGANKREIDGLIEKLGLDYQIATRLTSWVAISKDITVDPRAPKRDETMPQQLPYGMSAEGLGLRAVSPARPGQAPASQTLAGKVMHAMRAAPARSRVMGDEKAKKDSFGEDERRREVSSSFGLSQGSRQDDDEAEGSEVQELSEEQAKGEAPGAPTAGAPPPPPAPMAQAPKKPAPEEKETLVRRITKAVFGGEKPADKAREPAPPRGAPQGRAKPSPRRFTARVVVNRDGRLVVEVAIDELPLNWKPANDAQVELSDGRIIKVAVDTSRTTADGSYAAGLTLMLAMTATLGGDPMRITLVCDGEVIELVL